MQSEQSYLLHVSDVEAMPEDATAIAMFPCCQTLASRRLRKKVLPVPPGASRKIMPSDPL